MPTPFDRTPRRLWHTLTLGLGLALASPATALDLGIVTGSSAGTYIEIGRDIADTIAPEGLSLDVRESAGSLTNVYAVRYTPGVQLGLVQSDVLAFLRARAEGLVPEPLTPTERDQLSEMIERIKLVHPLYIEEVHILAPRSIRSVEELAGRRVSFGRNGGGTFITAEQLFRTLDVPVVPISDIAPLDAIEFMRAGEIDAMVYVVGQPASLFETLDLGEEFHFIPLNAPRLLQSYDPARIARSSYPWLDTDIETVGVRSILISYDYKGRENCDAIGRLAEAIAANIDRLRRSGHPKWNAVALDAEVAGWQRYACAGAAPQATVPLADAPAPAGEPAPASFLDGFRR
ncbi:MAG: TAXI family TRAP transporter solute-binding subunit [Pseudomonadota bacterium]